MLSRKYTRKIGVYLFTEVPDGYGGFIGKYILDKEIFAEVKTISTGQRFREAGYNALINPLRIKVRYHATMLEDVNTRFKINDKFYSVSGTENVDEENRFITMIVTENPINIQ